MEADKLLGYLQPFQNKWQKVVEDHSTGDIIAAILDQHKKHTGEYQKIAKHFTNSTDQLPKQLFNFLKYNVRYIIEPGEMQSVASPAAILARGKGDCKHYSSFINGIAQAKGIPFVYRFASYKYFDKTPGHVFAVWYPGTSREIWIDPVLPNLDNRKPYFHAIDKKPMAVYTINGIGATKKQKRQERRAARKAAGKTLGQKLKKGARAVIKVAASPARNAFLLLVKINFANLAVKMDKAWKKAPAKLKNFWEGAGGKMEALKKAFEKGRSKKRILGVETYHPEIGAAPAAAAAAAAPLLVKVAQLLKEIGIEPQELVNLGKEALNNKVQQLVKQKLVPQAEQEAVNEEVANLMEEQAAAPGSPAPGTSTSTSTGNKFLIPAIIGGAAIIYFATKKR